MNQNDNRIKEQEVKHHQGYLNHPVPEDEFWDAPWPSDELHIESGTSELKAKKMDAETKPVTRTGGSDLMFKRQVSLNIAL